jgi:dethiobiotin synthase
MLKGLFVTGTDTGVGKTTVSAALMHRYCSQAQLCYWKPIQTGIEEDDDSETVRTLASCAPGQVFDQGARLPRPLSPHLAAKLAGETLEVEVLVDLIHRQPSSRRWVVEGAGGVLVPINDTDTMVDLMLRLALPVVVVARSGLGTINHTLLTLEALRRRSLVVAGVVMAGDPNADNREAIEHFGNVRVLAQMPRFSPLKTDALRSWAAGEFDQSGVLREFLL